MKPVSFCLLFHSHFYWIVILLLDIVRSIIVNKFSVTIVIIGQVISAGLDKKILSWDTRTEKSSVCVNNLDSEVTSMSLSGLDMMVAVGTSIYVYDLRNLERPFQAKESQMDVQIICISSIPYAKGNVLPKVFLNWILYVGSRSAC